MTDFDALIDRDVFIEEWCARCGYTGILYATPRYHFACPRCLEERMRLVRETGVELPEWFLHVEKVARAHASHQAREALEGPTVRLDDLYKCAVCGTLIRLNEIMVHTDPETHSSPIYCSTCHADVAAGRKSAPAD
jgi:rubrerythrin